jgi:hypothetical protein
MLLLGLSCELARQGKPPPSSVERPDRITIFLTGNELGALQPCGCSGGQLGGLDRRAAIFSAVPKHSRLIVDTGSLVAGDGEQDLIKLNTIIRAFDLLGYDLVNLTAKDVERLSNLGLLNSIGSIFNVIAAEQPVDTNIARQFSRHLSLNAERVAVTVAAFDAESNPVGQIKELFPPPTDVRTVDILILTQSDAGIIESITQTAPSVDCVVCPADSDEPLVTAQPSEKGPLVFSVGRYGRYVCRLQITEAAQGRDRLQVAFQDIPVKEELPQELNLVRLYKDYQQLVKEQDLLAKYPRFSLPNGVTYVGSESCKPCHLQEYEQWNTTGHAQAYATLEEVGSQFDPECVICHVVGMEYKSGFISQEQTAHLKNVGCENCHGPGSEHVKTPGKIKTSGPKSTCLDCHTPEKSTHYAGNEQLYLEKIIHWREPNAPANVE